jgi:hypothetical protein
VGNDAATLVARVARAAQEGDASLKLGKTPVPAVHAEARP